SAHNRPAAYAGLGKPRPLIPVPPQRDVEFRFQEFLDEAANAGPHPGFQGIEPIVPKEKCSFGRDRPINIRIILILLREPTRVALLILGCTLGTSGDAIFIFWRVK